jgi:hypothetical protein
MRDFSIVLLIAVATPLVAYGQEIPNPSFEQPQLQPSLGYITPGARGHGEAAPMLEWSFGYSSGVCIEDKHHAAGLSAAEGRQVAFIQGQRSSADDASVPRNMFGGDVVGLKPGEEYEISWQQTGRATDTGTGSVTVRMLINDGTGVPPVVLLQKEPVGTKGQWETKSAWFTATAPTMRLQVVHFVEEAGNSPDDPETTLFDDFKIRAGRSAD